jgi:hypothetical protein
LTGGDYFIAIVESYDRNPAHGRIPTTTVAPGTGRPNGLKTVPDTDRPESITCSLANARDFATVVLNSPMM